MGVLQPSTKGPGPVHARLKRIIVATGALTAALLFAGVGPVAGDQDPTTPSTASSDFVDPDAKGVVRDSVEQARATATDDAINRLSDWLDSHRREAAAGWAGARLDDGNLRIFWRGEVPLGLSATLDRSSAPYSFESARFSARDFDDAIQRLLNGGYGVASAAPSSTFDAIDASVVESDLEEMPDSMAGIPIAYTAEKGTFSLAAGRGSDVPPFYGGGQVVSTAGNICGVAFAVEEPNGTTKLITARHCGQNLQFSTPAGTIVGGSGGGLASLDSVLLANSALPYMAVGRTFTGSWNSTSWLPVGGTRVAVVGDGMCANGAWSGQRCRNEIVATNVWVYSSQLGMSIGPGFWSENVDSLSQAGVGDSGSASIKLFQTPDSVRVLGVLNGIDSQSTYVRSCQGLTGGRTCSTRVFYIQVGALLAGHGVTLSTS